MMDAVTKALSDIKRQIPRQILEDVFRIRYNARHAGLKSIDDSIINQVIQPRVMIDCSLLGGDEVLLPMESAELDNIDAITQVYHFPKAMTNDRSIVSVLAIEYYNPFMTAWMNPATGQCQAPFNLQLGRMMSNVHAPQPKTFNARTTLIGENTVLVKGFNLPVGNYGMRVILEYGNRMAGLNPRHYKHFSKLCVLATKAHCYNVRVIDIGEAELSGGRELGRYNQVVDGYSDADEQYEDYLEAKWPKIAMLGDDESMTQFYRLQVRGF